MGSSPNRTQIGCGFFIGIDMFSSFKVDMRGQGLPRFQDAAEVLGTAKAKKAYGRAINHTGRKGFTGVKRVLAGQVGMTQTKLVKKGNIKTRSAHGNELSFVIFSTGSHLSLKEFGAKQFGYGVRAKPWGNSRRFKSAFIFAGNSKSGKFVGNGHVFKRTTNSALPIEKLHGPAIPNEMVKGDSAKAFDKSSKDLGRRIRHEIKIITKGVVS